MEDADVDAALIGAGFALIAERGWHRFSVAAAARAAGIPLDRARARCARRGGPSCAASALADRRRWRGRRAKGREGPAVRPADAADRRVAVASGGVIALLKALPFDPVSALLLAEAGQVSMGWMLQAAGSRGGRAAGAAAAQGAARRVALDRAGLRRGDESEDLSATMAALDRGADAGGAVRVAGATGRRRRGAGERRAG
jgi:hypothetical protein